MSLFDENADVLRQIEARGVDLTQTRTVDFSHVFSTESSANRFIEACRQAGFEAVDTTDEEMTHYDVTVSLAMVPNCTNITAMEEQFHHLAEKFDGYADGWGFMSS